MAGTRRGFGAGPDSIRDGSKVGVPAFSKDGTLTVMQVADVQEGVDVRPETTMLLERALDACEPDLVVFTGDQLKGYSLPLRLSGDEGIRKTIADILRPVTERGIPFAVTYGNHDCQAGLVNERLEQIYRELPGCMNAIFGDEGKEPGTFCVPIMASDGSSPAMAVWLADSGGDAPMGGYEAFDPENSFVARRRGMLLGYSPTASFSSYGPGLDRAVRVLRFSEADPRHPVLGLLSYRDLVGEETTQPIRDWMKTHMATTVEEVLDKLPRLPRVSCPDVPGTASLPGDGAMAGM